jgi:hypothetical protein
MSKYAQDFNLEWLDIIIDNGQSIKLKLLFVELNLFEDLFSFTCSGNVILEDALGLIQKLKLDGSEVLDMGYRKFADGEVDRRKFRIYKIGNRKPKGNKNLEYFTMYFTSEELFISEQLKITKSFKGMDISNMIARILYDEDNGMNVDIGRIKGIQESYGTYRFVIPKLKPLEAISWLSNYALPAEGAGADMLFFETKKGFYFNSLKTLFDKNPYAVYKYQPSDLPGQPLENYFTILDYEFIKTFDSLSATSAGIYANRLITIDPITRTKTVTDFTKGDLNGYDSGGTSLNRFGKYSEEMYESNLKLSLGNSTQKETEYIKKSPNSVTEDIRAETYIPNRIAQVALANRTIMKAIIPGNSDITVGKIIYVSLPALGVNDGNSATEDEYYSGKYLVTALRHIIQSQGVFQTVLELAKNTMVQTKPKLGFPSQTVVI